MTFSHRFGPGRLDNRSTDELSVYQDGGSSNAILAEAIIPNERTPKRKRSRAEAELNSNADANDDDDDNGDWQQKNAIVIRRIGIKMTPTVRVSGQKASIYLLSMNNLIRKHAILNRIDGREQGP